MKKVFKKKRFYILLISLFLNSILVSYCFAAFFISSKVLCLGIFRLICFVTIFKYLSSTSKTNASAFNFYVTHNKFKHLKSDEKTLKKIEIIKNGAVA